MQNIVSPVISLAEAMAALVGPHFGVIESLERVPPESDDVPLSVYAGRLANTAAFAQQSAPRITSGAGLTDEQARWACLGESVERYCAALIPPAAVVLATANELPGRVVLPTQLALFQWSQHTFRGTRFPFRQWSTADRIGWVSGRSLADGRAAWLPAFSVFQPYPLCPNEKLLAPTISTGLACHSSWHEAVLGGLLEVLERDALALAWLGRVPLPQVDPRSLMAEGSASQLVRNLDQMRFRWTVLEATTAFRVPTFVALVEGHSPVGSIVSCGSACHPEPLRAMTKALVEAVHCRLFVKSLCRETPNWDCGRGFANVTNFADHARLYSSHPEHRRALEFWWNAQERPIAEPFAIESGSAESRLADIVGRLVRQGAEPFAFDLTSPDIGSLGLHVARVVIPGLQPLHGNHHWPHLGGSRLRRLRQVFCADARQPWRWNSWPHPFA